MNRGEWFRQFCNTLQSNQREMNLWLRQDLEENILAWQHPNEVRRTA